MEAEVDFGWVSLLQKRADYARKSAAAARSQFSAKELEDRHHRRRSRARSSSCAVISRPIAACRRLTSRKSATLIASEHSLLNCSISCSIAAIWPDKSSILALPSLSRINAQR